MLRSDGDRRTKYAKTVNGQTTIKQLMWAMGLKLNSQ